MDPDAALAQIRATVEAMAAPECTAEQRRLLAGDLVTLWDGLDSWLSRGGFLPHSWRDREPMPLMIWADHTTTEPTSFRADRLLDGHLPPGQVAVTLGVVPAPPEGRPEVIVAGTPEEIAELALGLSQFAADLAEEE